MNMRGLLFGGLVTALVGVAAPASAVEIVGTLNISGEVIVSGNTITWLPPVGINAPETSGFSLVTGGTGYFQDPGNGGTAIYQPSSPAAGPVYTQSLNLAQSGPPAGYSLAPAGGPVSVPNFLSGFADYNGTGGNTLNSEYSDLTFELTQIIVPSPVLGACVPGGYAVGESCNLGPFLLTQNATSVTLSLNILGIFRDPSLGIESLTATGAYSTQINVPAFDTIQEIGTHLSTGGSIQNSYSATFTAPVVPEPATLVTFGLGSLIAARARRRKKN